MTFGVWRRLVWPIDTKPLEEPIYESAGRHIQILFMFMSREPWQPCPVTGSCGWNSPWDAVTIPPLRQAHMDNGAHPVWYWLENKGGRNMIWHFTFIQYQN
jgi:hypothetical protein